MTGMHLLGSFSLGLGIQTEDDRDHFLPVSTFRIGVQQPQIGYEMLPIVAREHGALRRVVFESSLHHRDPVPNVSIQE